MENIINETIEGIEVITCGICEDISFQAHEVGMMQHHQSFCAERNIPKSIEEIINNPANDELLDNGWNDLTPAEQELVTEISSFIINQTNGEK